MPVGAQQFPPGASSESPLDSATARLAAVWCEVLGLESVGPDENYFDLGGDSSLAVELFARVEQEFGRKLPLATLFDAATVRALAAVICSDSPSTSSPLVRIQPEGTQRPLYLVHDATGDVLGYRNLARRLGTARPVYGLQAGAPAEDAVGEPTVEGLARRYVDAVREVQPVGPYYLGGYCGGGTIAYEMAQQLTAAGERVSLLALVDTFNWAQLPPRSRLGSLWFGAERFVFLLGNFFALHGSGRRQFFRDKKAALAARVRDIRTRGLHQVWNADLAAMGFAFQRYDAKPYSGLLLDLRPQSQHRRLRGEQAKWGGLARGGQEILILPVGARGILLEPLVQHLADALNTLLSRADAEALAAPQPAHGKQAPDRTGQYV